MGSVTKPAQPSEPAGAASRLETCTVRRWRGYRTYTFFAELDDGTVVAESGAFREARRAAEPSAAARARHRELVGALEACGWERARGSGGAEWYGTALERRVEARESEPAPPAEISPPRPETPVGRLDALAGAVARPVREEARPPAAAEPPPARASRWTRKTAAVAGVGLAAIVGAAGVSILDAGSPRAHASAPPQAPGRHTAAAAHAAPKQVAAAAVTGTRPVGATRIRSVAALPSVHVTIAAPTRASWLEIRRASAHGRVLFSGELVAGKHLAFTGTKLWARFGAAGNLSISVDGKELPLLGTFEHVFRASRPAR